MLKLLLSFLSLLFLTACSPDKENSPATEENIQNNIQKLTTIAPQPALTQRADETIAALETGYGTFGAYSVETKSIKNTRYDYKERYKALNLNTTLFYPKDANKPLPTLFFYSGYRNYNPDAYKGLLYFVASKGYNIIFLTCPDVELRNLKAVTQDAIDAFSSQIDRSKVGFIGHSMGAGVTFWMINEFKELGTTARIHFPMASGYTIFNNTSFIPDKKTLTLPENTKAIHQVYAKDYTTDMRIGIDLFLNTSLSQTDKDYMYIYGDDKHIAGHACMTNRKGYDVDALMQRTIFRPLDALMDEAFNNNNDARRQLKAELVEDNHFNPYIGKTPQYDLQQYVLPEENYSYNCSKGGNVASLRNPYCNALGL